MLLKKSKKIFIGVLLLSVLSSQVGAFSSKAYENTSLENANSEVSEENLHFETIDEYFDYVAYSINHDQEFFVPVESTIKPRYYGWKEDYDSASYFWHKTATGKCIKGVTSPTAVLFGVVSGFTPKELAKMGVKGIAKNLTKRGVAVGVAWNVAKCMWTYRFK